MQLQTPRLTIRPFTPIDEPAVVTLFTDPGFNAWSVGPVLDAKGARARLARFIDLQANHGFSKLALLERTTGNLIGYCGFGLLTLDGPPQPELGYRLRADAQGRGYATEAAGAVISDAFTRLRLPFVQAYLDEGNLPSLRVLEKLGFRFQRRFTDDIQEWVLYRLDAPASES